MKRSEAQKAFNQGVCAALGVLYGSENGISTAYCEIVNAVGGADQLYRDADDYDREHLDEYRRMHG